MSHVWDCGSEMFIATMSHFGWQTVTVKYDATASTDLQTLLQMICPQCAGKHLCLVVSAVVTLWYRHREYINEWQICRCHSFFKSRISVCSVHDGYNRANWRTNHCVWVCMTMTWPLLYANESIQHDGPGSWKSDQTLKLGSVDKI